ncbi:hypothetical protein JR316_0012907 [Psilocybe cubensis]|uniref:Uncharacterized protein n=2 Tax=Psilocybe cubensis TaxID=181762 RepID=A0ACB8GFY3_PSICU|nr:hypothetical protein JR316_0012907 [Psilocybe cubensis]KAH9474448.1 hypothetical protein JR316_0012907 [Psilocybe cubensis]
MPFVDLPLEILPEILAFVVKPQHLWSACLVNSNFKAFATLRLYEKISIYSWHKEGKVKVIHLFDTLARSEYLASLLQRLELRDFPKSTSILDDEVLRHVLQALSNCKNLKSCTWTRDGSLNSEILSALSNCESLQEFEFNGHSDGHYDPRLLLGFAKLTKISMIMPSASVIAQLPSWTNITGNSLRNLTLICKSSLIITDRLLETLAPSLVNLEHLHLTGCPKVTEQGLWALVSSNIHGLLGLGIEGVSPKFNMFNFANKCVSHGSLNHLRSVTLTVHHQLPMKEWISAAVHLVSASPLELFQIYSTGAFFESPMTDDLWNQLISTHGRRLIRFSVHRMLISLEAIRSICRFCVNLEQLFIVVEPKLLDRLSECLSHAKKLQTIHINYPMEASPDAHPVLLPEHALSIVNSCSSTITQFGCNAKVWQVGRRIITDDAGDLQALRTLVPYGNPGIPEQFLVVRT